MLYLYAIIGAGAPATDAKGLGDAPVRQIAAADVVAVVSEHESLEVRPVEAAVVRHAAVVDGLAARASAVLPARFGETFPDEAALAERLREHGAELRVGLSEVEGCVELGLRVAERDEGRSPERPAGSTGRAYMQALHQWTAAAERRAAQVHEPLEHLSVRSDYRRGAGRRLLFSAAYLVGRDRVPAFLAEVERLQREHRELALVCTGPWPPYNFVSPRLAPA